jgi:hypothetical protein
MERTPMRKACQALVALWLAWPAAARADAPTTRATGESDYERATLASAMGRVGGAIDPSPEGKRVESIEIVVLDPIEPRDPAPSFLNEIHITTRRYVIAREVLLHRGDPYRQTLVDETARNLRKLPQLSIVLCTALRGSSPDAVRVLVVTKDVWSLFVDFDFSIAGGRFEQLILKPREMNVAGRHTTAFARFVLEPAAYSLGAGYIVPRIEGRRLALAFDANLMVNRARGEPEGSFGSVSVSRPLFSTQTEWAFVSGVSWRDEVFRKYTNAEVATIDGVPWSYRSRVFYDQAAATRSFGWRNKSDLTLGVELANRAYESREPAVRAVMPLGERRIGPFFQWNAYTNTFVRTLDIETLGLQEDVRLGPELVVRAYPVLHALGATRTFVGLSAALQVTLPLGDGFARASLTSVTETERERLTDASIEGALRVVSPRLGFGRLLFDATVLDRYRNYLHAISFLGGEGRMRGYPTRYLSGSDVVAMNLELRTRPIELASVQVGASAFYDVGDAFDGLSDLHPRHSAGVGLRLVLPQIDRSVVRVDVGVPLGERPADVGRAAVFIAFNHAFPLATVSPTTTTPPTIGGALGY